MRTDPTYARRPENKEMRRHRHDQQVSTRATNAKMAPIEHVDEERLKAMHEPSVDCISKEKMKLKR